MTTENAAKDQLCAIKVICEQQSVAKMNTRAMVGMITDWVKKGMKDDYMNYSEQNVVSLDRECFVVGGKYLMLS